jgi:predicted transcriptional regulator
MPVMTDTRTRSRLTPRQCAVLHLMEDGEWHTSQALADRLGTRSKAALTTLLNKLARGGWLEQERIGAEDDWYAERRYRYSDRVRES